MRKFIVFSMLPALLAFALPTHAQEGGGTQGAAAVKAAFAPAPGNTGRSPAQTLGEPDVLIFTAPPRETPEEGQEIYGPIAEYLSQVIGKKIVYRHPGTWGVYRTMMLRGEYDLIFDGPHFNSYRAEKLDHTILVKIPVKHEFVVITRKTEPYQSLREMAGRVFCAEAPPNLGTLILLGQFDNPARQPLILNTKGWDNIYQGVASGRCAGGVLPLANLKKLDKEGNARILYKTQPMPNQAFSAGPRITREDQARLAAALLAPQAAGPTERLRATYRVGEGFVAASNQEYAGLADFLRNEWGYY